MLIAIPVFRRKSTGWTFGTLDGNKVHCSEYASIEFGDTKMATNYGSHNEAKIVLVGNVLYIGQFKIKLSIADVNGLKYAYTFGVRSGYGYVRTHVLHLV